MKSVLCLFVCCIFSVGFAIPAQGEPLTLSEAVKRALAHAPTLDIQRQVIQEYEGAKTDAGLLPNPVVSYTREDLRRSGLKDGEWMVSASLPLAFLWARGPEVRAATAQVQAQMLTLEHLQKEVRFQVQKAFVAYHFAREKHRVTQKASALFQEAARTGKVRLAEGDISPYAQHRLTLEALHYDRLEAEAQMELNQFFRNLSFYMQGQYAQAEIETVLDVPTEMSDVSLDVVIPQAMTHRSDLQMAKVLTEAGEASWAAARRRGWPETEVSFGFKRQVDGFDGGVFEVGIGLPVFNRNQGKIKTAQASFERRRLTEVFLQKQVQQDVTLALDRYRLYGEQVKHLEQVQASPDSMLEIARFAYLEGEMSLIEMLDGVRAYSEAFQARLDVLSAYHISRFELEKAIGHPLSELK